MDDNKQENKIISDRKSKKIIFAMLFIFIFDFLFFSAPVLASSFNNKTNISDNAVLIKNSKKIVNNLPISNDWQAKKAGYYTLTAYNSEVGQCDNSPCITANGFNLCQHNQEDSVAVNFLPFGTKIRIPEIFGNKVFTVRDRMNSRYYNRFDIWMKSKIKAKKFGIRVAKVEILEEH